jgi:hypothetical protein
MSKRLDIEKIASIARLIAPALMAGGAVLGGKHLFSYLNKDKSNKRYAMERDFDYRFKNKPWLGQIDKNTDTVVHNPNDWTSFRSLMQTYTPEERRALKEEGLLRYNHVWDKADVVPKRGLPQAYLAGPKDKPYSVPESKPLNIPDSIKEKMDAIRKATIDEARKSGRRPLGS